jgi:hypothetical protein
MLAIMKDNEKEDAKLKNKNRRREEKPLRIVTDF